MQRSKVLQMMERLKRKNLKNTMMKVVTRMKMKKRYRLVNNILFQLTRTRNLLKLTINYVSEIIYYPFCLDKKRQKVNVVAFSL